MQLNVRNHASTKSIAAAFIRIMSGDPGETVWLQKFAFVAIVITALILVPVSLFVFSATAHAASLDCGDASSNHCYATWNWQGAARGSTTDITILHMSCFKQGCAFIDNEMWLVDTSSQHCTSNKWNDCWVEGGYIADNSVGCLCYFWADVRPVDGNNLNYHLAGGIRTNDYNHSLRMRIYQQVSGQFAVLFLIQGSCSNCTPNQSFTSVDNSMAPDLIQIGQELAATTPSNLDAEADIVDYTNNYYYAAGKWWPQTGSGNGPGPIQYAPPYEGWVDNVVGGPTGGDFYTYCC